MLKRVIILCAVAALSWGGEFFPFEHEEISFPENAEYDPIIRRLYGKTEATTESQGKEYNEASKQYGQTKGEKKYIAFMEKLNWNEAKDACKKRGMQLASPTSFTEEAKLENFLRDNDFIPADQYSGYWIGNRRLSDTGPWLWETTGQEISYSTWLPGEPNYYTGENCMELKKDWSGLGWNNYYCNDLRRFICEEPERIHESDKNDIQEEKKYTLHEEMAKESPEKEESANQDLENISRIRTVNQWLREAGVSTGNIEASPEITEDLESFSIIPNEPQSNLIGSTTKGPQEQNIVDRLEFGSPEAQLVRFPPAPPKPSSDEVDNMGHFIRAPPQKFDQYVVYSFPITYASSARNIEDISTERAVDIRYPDTSFDEYIDQANYNYSDEDY